MPLNFPNVGENIVLEVLVNKTTPHNLVLRLFTNNVTPADTDVAGTYTEATFAGYSPITLTGASWNNASGGTISYGSQQTFTRSSTGTTENVYGYFVTQATTGLLVYSERDGAAPFAVTNNGDAIKITPTISAN